MSQHPGPCRILYVDDHADTLMVVKKLLAMDGHTIVIANSFAAALKEAREQRFDLLISDVGLPDGDGLMLLTEIRKLYAIKGIVVSGYGMATDVLDSDLAGYAIHLTKPIDFARLRDAVNQTTPECADHSASAKSA